MHVDHALAMNRRIATQPEVYYFSVPCSATRRRPDGIHVPLKGMEPLFVMRSHQIGAYAGRTEGGYAIDDTWRENDGLVNTVSSSFPLGAPAKPLDRSRIDRGIWNVFPAWPGDHMALQGGLIHRHDVRGFYQDLLTMISALQSKEESE